MSNHVLILFKDINTLLSPNRGGGDDLVFFSQVFLLKAPTDGYLLCEEGCFFVCGKRLFLTVLSGLHLDLTRTILPLKVIHQLHCFSTQRIISHVISARIRKWRLFLYGCIEVNHHFFENECGDLYFFLLF